MMPVYRNMSRYITTLKWSDCFEDATDFETKVVSIGTDSENLDVLYEILYNKYHHASTRYMEVESFVLGLRRELQIKWPLYLKQKSILDQLMALTVDDIILQSNTLRNLVNNVNESGTSRNKVAIENLSTEQENLYVTSNKLEALRSQYNASARDYLAQIYQSTDVLFKAIPEEYILKYYNESVGD